LRLKRDAPKTPGRVTVRLEVSSATETETGSALVLPFELNFVN
jgi:hypothetical protein